jgi:hypothetical protein
MWNKTRLTRRSYPGNEKRHTRTKIFPVTRDHSEVNSVERTVETRGEVLRFQIQSLMPDIPRQLKLRSC